MSYNHILKKINQVFNFEKAESYKLSPEMELYTAVCTMALQPKFYETPMEQVERIAKLVTMVDHMFVAKLAIYARKEMYLRSVPLLLVVELAKIHKGDDLVSRTVEQVVMRADEIMELLMCYQWRNPQKGEKKLCKLSHQIQIGLQKAFNKFDEYEFGKYNSNNLEVKLRDALFIVHPKAKDNEQQKIFNKITWKTLKTPYTWETELSAIGQHKYTDKESKDNAFKEKWEELIQSGRLGYMALLRNLRNILNVNVDDECINIVTKQLTDPNEVLRAKQFPFRYLSAYKELKNVRSFNTPALLTALEKAVNTCAEKITGFSNKTRVMISCDMSGSMVQPISLQSKMHYYEVGIMLAMLLKNRCDKVITGIFGDEWKVINLPQENILSNTCETIQRIGEVGFNTYGCKPIDWLIKEKIVVDKVMFFTDCQFWGDDEFGKHFINFWNTYKKISPNAHLYLFDLAGYGYSPIRIPRQDVTLIAGWSDRIFEMMDCIENGEDIINRDIKCGVQF
ncbi:MAG: TROVE domain-containing protein [Bacteroidaceae bacterium]|nr:TROVE domain-containing protein [Bacteroidaceae bacterium]